MVFANEFTPKSLGSNSDHEIQLPLKKKHNRNNSLFFSTVKQSLDDLTHECDNQTEKKRLNSSHGDKTTTVSLFRSKTPKNSINL